MPDPICLTINSEHLNKQKVDYAEPSRVTRGMAEGRLELLAAEKEFTRQRDALTRRRKTSNSLWSGYAGTISIDAPVPPRTQPLRGRH
jgi:hypothetical protein